MQTATKSRAVKRSPVVIMALLSLLLSGCVTTLGRAKQAAQVSETVYNGVKTEVVQEISDIVQKDQNKTITDQDRARLKLLNELRQLLDQYADVHNTYVSALKVWDSSGTKPTNVDALDIQMLDLIKQIQVTAKNLHIKLGQ